MDPNMDNAGPNEDPFTQDLRTQRIHENDSFFHIRTHKKDSIFIDLWTQRTHQTQPQKTHKKGPPDPKCKAI